MLSIAKVAELLYSLSKSVKVVLRRFTFSFRHKKYSNFAIVIKPTLYTLLFLILSVNAIAQSDTTSIRVAMRLLDTENNKPIANAQTISYMSQHHFVTNKDGVIIYSFPMGDSLRVFGMGYEALTLQVSDFIGVDSIVDIMLTRRTYMIQGVDVGGTDMHLHLPDDIKLGKNEDLAPAPLRNDGFSGKPPLIAAVVSPASYIFYHTSKSEKRKRNMRAELAKHEQQEIVDEFYNAEVIKEISAYEGDTLNSFIIYCNTHLTITSRTNPLIVKQLILDTKEEFEKRE